MRYLGGKCRQSKEIVNAIRRLRPNFKVYVEPFCGAMWSACAVIRAFPGRKYLLSDHHKHLMSFWIAAKAGFNPPRTVTQATYDKYKETRPEGDPMTGYLGFALSFGGKFYGGFARDKAGVRVFAREASGATQQKVETLRAADVVLATCDYQDAEPPPVRGNGLFRPAVRGPDAPAQRQQGLRLRPLSQLGRGAVQTLLRANYRVREPARLGGPAQLGRHCS